MSQVQLKGEQEEILGTQLPLLEVTDLRVKFKKNSGIICGGQSVVNAVDGVSFQLKASEIACIVGESGSGKTTVANCILRLIQPDSGSIKFKGVEVTKLAGRQLHEYRKEVQIIYQDPFESLNPRNDVFTTVSYPIRFLTGLSQREEIYELVRKLLEEVGLDSNEVMHRYPHQLSGGQRQRINIARALASNPKLLVADEPITMLDAAQRLNILSLLYELKVKRNLTVLMITHDLASARLVSEKIIVMYLGKVVEYGPTDSILSQPHHPYVELLLKASPSAKSQSFNADEYLYSTIEESSALTNGCIFRPRCKYAQSKCESVVPTLEEKTRGHYAACHFSLNLESQE
jgi:oligopeptide/dipeptide ABC transporter ATP-binding protein